MDDDWGYPHPDGTFQMESSGACAILRYFKSRRSSGIVSHYSRHQGRTMRNASNSPRCIATWDAPKTPDPSSVITTLQFRKVEVVETAGAISPEKGFILALPDTAFHMGTVPHLVRGLETILLKCKTPNVMPK